ncbi:MAG: hypothetical protein ACK5ZJ_04490 [Acidobacteriota bacterium]
MATDKQIAANRRHAPKSTGRRTAAGKFCFSLHALRHGFYARHFVIFTEDDSAFGQFSRESVETMNHAAWRRRRVLEIVQARINQAVEQAIAQLEASSPLSWNALYPSSNPCAAPRLAKNFGSKQICQPLIPH